MANFTTHIAVGTVVSGGLATLTVAADVIGPESLVAVTMAGVLGSILPDIDLKDSRPSRIMFSGLAVFFSFCVLFANAGKFSIAELWLLWLGTFVTVRYGAEAAFHRFSYHRGIWHSILAGVMFWFLTTIVFKLLLGRHDGVAWLGGGFLFIGYMTHLILDEIYSVDVLDRRLKLSFGSALKLADFKHPGETATVAAVAALAFVLAPSSQTFIESMSSRQLWVGLHQKLLPQDKWFGVIGDAGRIFSAAPKADADALPAPVIRIPASQAVPGLTTGSIPAVTPPAAGATKQP